MSLTATTAIWFLDKIAGMVTEEGAKGLWSKVRDRGAVRALANACTISLEAAASVAPSIAEDIRSESFRGGVVLPLVRDLLERPSALIDPGNLADQYVGMFVASFARTEGVDVVLARVFQTNRRELLAAFGCFLETLKGELYASEHWREAQHYHTAEVTAANVGRIAEMLEANRAEARAALVDLDRARADAATASVELRAWPSEIHGVRLETPALERLVRRITSEPVGRTLLVGEAGTGKSALFARLAPELEAAGVTVFAIKADLLPASVATLDQLAAALGVGDGLEDHIAALAAEAPVALLLDQLDAVSDVMDRQSGRMRLLLQLVHRLGSRQRASGAPLNIHVLVSSRRFEAAHDARFNQLHAETVCLDLLDEAQVDAMLVHLGLVPTEVDERLRGTLRRPFALKLFADIVARGATSRDLTPAGLLDAWLTTADLGDARERQETAAFLVALAEEMIATETLWRPADALEMGHAAALRRAEAAGLVVRSGASVGFSHQSWLDDFQAKSFRTGRDLAEYCWARQDTLFIRASVLRSLERLRIRDLQGYEGALRALLGGTRTRRHILHLVADIIAIVPDPLPFELGWVIHWIGSDPPLARRALRQIEGRWRAWRDGLRDELPSIMAREAFEWSAARLLAAEVRLDADFVARLVDRFWDEPAKDRLVFEILEQSDFVGLDVEARLRSIFARTSIEDHSISHMARTMRMDGRAEEAAAVVALWVENQPFDRSDHSKIYELEKLAEAAPLALASRLLPWFLGLVAGHVGEPNDLFTKYPRSLSLPHDWDMERDQGSPFTALNQAIAFVGRQNPEAFWTIVQPLLAIEIDQVQELVVTGLTAAGPALADRSLSYLLADARRFEVSHVIAAVGDGVIGSIEGWHSQELVRAIVPYLSPGQLDVLRDAIEAWSYYTEAALHDATGAERRRQALDDHRFPLLDALPAGVPSRERAVGLDAWRARRRKVKPRPRLEDLSGWVGSPMTHEEMAQAKDAEVRAALDEFNDGSGEHGWSVPVSRSGGVRELSRAFGAFGKANPARAMEIASGLEPGRHERAVGALIRELSGAEEVDQSVVLELVLNMDARGFATAEWRSDAASALQNVARRLGGLDDGIVPLLEGWLETDPDAIARQTTERLEFEARNPCNHGSRDEPQPILFGSGGGMDVLPNNNFTILSAIAAALLCREAPDCNAWCAALERHAERPEDPAIWTAILTWRGEYLSWADAERVPRLLARVHQRFPDAWRDIRLTRFLWRLRRRVPDEVLIPTMVGWMHGEDATRQAAAEFLSAAHLVESGAQRYRLLFERLDRSVSIVEVGVLFSASAAWRERDPVLRPAAHAILMGVLGTASGGAAHALSRAIDTRPELLPDAMTLELVEALPRNPDVLQASLTHAFADALQALLFYPGFDGAVLSVIERATDFVTASRRIGIGMRGEELVQVAIALQRSDGPLRARAMDVYERLLDAAVYGAEEAAKASLSR